jgi:2-isopropylmalate synthase
MTPASVGVTATTIVLGKHSGRKALEHRFTELGHSLTKNELERVYMRFTELADKKKAIYDEDLIGLLRAPQAEVTTAN